jgi:hypothetical protein
VVVANAQPLASRVFDWSVLGVAAVLTAFATVLAIDDGRGNGRLFVALLVGLPVMVLVSRYPVTLDRPGGAIEIGYDSFVLAYLGTLLHVHDAAWIWALGAVLAAALARHRWAATVFNIGVQTTCGIVALWVIGTLGTDDLASLQRLLQGASSTSSSTSSSPRSRSRWRTTLRSTSRWARAVSSCRWRASSRSTPSATSPRW